MSSTLEFRLSRCVPRFRLRTLLVLVTLFGAVLGLIGRELQHAFRQKQAAAEVQRRGGHVSLREATGPVSGLLRLVLGDEYCAEACSVLWSLRSEEDLDLLQAFPELPSLYLVGANVTDAALGGLTGLNQLDTLSLKGAVISDRGLKSLSELPKLKRLTLYGCTLSDGSLKGLYGAQSLDILCFEGTVITEAEFLAIRKAIPALTVALRVGSSELGFPSVQELPQAQGVTLWHYMSDATVAVLRDARALTDVGIERCRVTDDGLKILGGLTQLKRLRLEFNATDKATQDLRPLPGSSHPAPSDCLITDRGLEHISRLSNLTHLIAYDCPITDRGLESIGRLGNLTYLVLIRAQVTDAGIRQLRPLQYLTVLILPGTAITGEGVRELQGLTKLKLLDVNDTGVTDQGLAEIAGLTSLLPLNLSRTRITDEGVRHLARMTSLSHLDLSGTQLTDRSIEDLCKLPLQRLDVSGTQMTRRGVERLRERLGGRMRVGAAHVDGPRAGSMSASSPPVSGGQRRGTE